MLSLNLNLKNKVKVPFKGTPSNGRFSDNIAIYRPFIAQNGIIFCRTLGFFGMDKVGNNIV